MRLTKKCQKPKPKGFTLIEMLLVITVIALIAAMALPGLGRIRQTARDAKRVADLTTVQTMLESYHNVNRQYPPSAADWSAFSSSLINAGIGISRVPKDPLATRFYSYGVSADRQDYTLRADLETNHQALEDDIDGTSNGLSCADSPNYYYCVKP